MSCINRLKKWSTSRLVEVVDDEGEQGDRRIHIDYEELSKRKARAIEEDFIGEEVSVDGGDDFDFDEDDEDDDDDDISIELANLNRKLIEDISLRDEQIQRLLREEQKQTIFIDKLQKSLQALEEDKTTLQNDVFVLEGITKANSSLEVRAKHAEDAQQALEKQNRGLARQTRLLQGDKADFEEEQKQWEEERGLLRDRLVKAKAQAALLAHAGVNTPEQERVRLEMQVEWEQEKEQTEELRRDLNRVKRSQGKQARQLGEDRRVIEEDRERLARELEMHEKKKRQLRGDFEQIEREKANLEHEKKQSKRSRDALAQERRKIEQGRKRITELSLLSGSPDLLKMEEERIQLDVERTRVQHDRGKLRALEGEVQEAQQRMQAREERLRELQSKVDADLAQQAAFQDKALKLEFERKQFSAEKTMLEQERTTLAAQKMKLAEERKSKSEHVPKELQEKLKVFKHSQKQLEREAEKLAVVKRKMEKEKKQLEEEKALLLHVKTTKLTPEEQSFVELKRETDRMDNILVALGAAPVPAYVNQQEDPIEQIKKEPIRIEITVSARNLIYMVDIRKRTDPIVAALEKNHSTGKFTKVVDQSEWIRQEHNPDFEKKFVFPLLPGGATANNKELRWSIYDVDSNKVRERDRMGSVDLKLFDDVLSKPANEPIVFSLRHTKNKKRDQRLLLEKAQLQLTYRLIRKTGDEKDNGDKINNHEGYFNAELTRLRRLNDTLSGISGSVSKLNGGVSLDMTKLGKKKKKSTKKNTTAAIAAIAEPMSDASSVLSDASDSDTQLSQIRRGLKPIDVLLTSVTCKNFTTEQCRAILYTSSSSYSSWTMLCQTSVSKLDRNIDHLMLSVPVNKIMQKSLKHHQNQTPKQTRKRTQSEAATQARMMIKIVTSDFDVGAGSDTDAEEEMLGMALFSLEQLLRTASLTLPSVSPSSSSYKKRLELSLSHDSAPKYDMALKRKGACVELKPVQVLAGRSSIDL